MTFKASKFDQSLDFMCEQLGMRKEELTNMLLDNAKTFLEQWVGEEHEQEISMWLGMPAFWVWWRQVWYQTDMRYLQDCSKLDFLQWRTRGEGMEIYRRWHQVERISYRPPSGIVSSWHKLIKSVAKPQPEAAI